MLHCRVSEHRYRKLTASKKAADLTQLEHSLFSAIDRIIYFQSASAVYNEALRRGGNTLRLAILQPPETESSYTPGVDTGRENGMEVELFYAEQKAVSWLNS